MPTNTRLTAALATEQDARGIPTMAQISALCGHKPPTVTDTAPTPSEAVTMDSTRNAVLSDAEIRLCRLGRSGEAYRLWHERTGASAGDFAYAFTNEREHSYDRAEAASAIVKAAREWNREAGASLPFDLKPLADAVTAYETLLEGGE